MNNQNGFTLLELLIVIFIVSILAAISIPTYQGYREGQEINKIQRCLELIAMAERDYYETNYEYWILPNTDLYTDPKITPKVNDALFAGSKTCPEEWAVGVYNKKHRDATGKIVNDKGYRANAYHPTKRLQLWIQDNKEKNASCHIAYDGWCKMAPHIGTCPTSCGEPYPRP